MIHKIHKVIICLFFVSIILLASGCPNFPERAPEEKNGRLYGLIRPFRHRWWNYYERGLSFADGGFWEKSMLDLQDAIRRRKDDRRRARTYGRHFIDYFPHRELGVAFYKQGKTEQAIKELEISLAAEKSNKAEIYLDRARRSLIEKRHDVHGPPEIIIKSPGPQFLTNNFSVVVEGIAKDKMNFVRRIEVGARKVRIDVSDREIPFVKEIPVRPGKNRIPVLAENLAGKIFETDIVVNVDCMGPLVSIDDIYENSEANLVVKGYAFDDSGISGFVINGRDFPVDGSPTELEIHEFVRIQQDKKELSIAVRDIAGNVTDVKTGINRTMQAVLTADASSSASDLRGFGNPAGLRISGTGNMSDCMTSPKSGLIKICINKKTEERTEQITYLNSAVIDGYIDSDELVELHIRRKTRKKKPENGDKKYELYEIYRKKFPRKQYHFTCVTELDEGENIINIRANQLSSGHSDAVAITIRRKKPDVEKYEARLNMFVAVFETKKTEDIRTMLITGFELLFADDLINHAPRRFHSVKNIKLGGDDEIVIKQANEKKFDCIVSGSIQERKNTVGERSVIINASIKDTESEQPVVKTVDVYAEDVSEDNVYDILKFLSHCLKLKLIDELPVVKGKVENKNKKVITVDIGKEKKVKKGMKLIVYNQENDSNSKELGEANIRSVEEKISHADLNEIKYSEVIRKGQSVITK